MKNLHIIKNNHEFQKIINKNNFISFKSFIIFSVKNESNFKYGISVGKKIGIAALRNKIKRQVRSSILNFVNNNNNLKKNVIIIVRKSYINETFTNNSRYLNIALNKIKLEA